MARNEYVEKIFKGSETFLEGHTGGYMTLCIQQNPQNCMT